jgi:hypothetical protein
MREPHVRFRERHGGVILRAYSTKLVQRGTPRLLRHARNDRGGRSRCHVPKRNNFARARRPPIFFDAVAPMHRIRLALNRGISGCSIIFIRRPSIIW